LYIQNQLITPGTTSSVYSCM